MLDFNMTTARTTSQAGVGGLLFLGNAAPPPDLAAQLDGALGPAGSARPLVMADQEGGGIQRLQGAVTYMPWPRQMAAWLTPAQLQALTTTVGRQMHQLGVTVDLAPVLDLDAGPGPSATDPDGMRSFSLNPATTTVYGLAFSRGLEAGGVLPVVKHFPGLGGSTGNTDNGPAATQPITALRRSGLLPFQAAIRSGAPAVMVANASVPGLTSLPASLSSAAINGLLRGDLGFGGLVLTDSLSAGAITAAGFNLTRAATAAVEAGADMVLFGSTLTPADTAQLTPANVDRSVSQIVQALAAAVATGALSTSRLNDAVAHVLAARGVSFCSG
jgi:beta-N-acetylhexosaminidase